MPPLTPEQAQKLAEQQKIINDELIRTQSLTEEIFEGNIQITNELKKSIAQANKLNVSFGIGKDISKQVSEERLKNATKIQKIDNDIAVKQAILSKTKSANQAKQLALEIQQLKTQQRVTEQIDAQLRDMEAFMEAEKRALELEKERNSTGTALKNIFKDAIAPFKELFQPAILLKTMIDSAFRFNKISTEIGKNLGYSAGKADAIATKFVDVAQNSSNINVTLANLGEAMSELNEATGFVANYSADALETQIMLTKQFGLTGNEAAGIYELSVLTGKSSSQVNDSMVGAFVNMRNQLRAGVPFKAVMAEAAKVSGQLAANLGNNPSQIVKAVTQAKALGTTLEQVKNQGEALLNFETSLENELKAELLTGKQLNLERARAAALTGDQVTLAQELNKNVGSLEEFQGMNVLQQKALAEAVGLTTDQLADQLRKQKLSQETGKSLAQITKEEALEAEKRQAIQDKFNQAILKLQDLIGNLVAGPLSIFLDGLSTALKIVGYIVKPIEWLSSLAELIGEKFGKWSEALGPFSFVLKGIAGVAIVLAAYGAYASLAWIPVVGTILGAAAAVAVMSKGFSALSAQKAGDMISPASGKTQVSTKEGGLFELSKNDDLLAGPGLADKTGGGVGGADKDRGSMGGNSIDITPMVTAINEVKAAVKELMNRPVVINMDSKQVGSSLVQNASYKSA
jgi:hypothetical protein